MEEIKLFDNVRNIIRAYNIYFYNKFSSEKDINIPFEEIKKLIREVIKELEEIVEEE